MIGPAGASKKKTPGGAPLHRFSAFCSLAHAALRRGSTFCFFGGGALPRPVAHRSFLSYYRNASATRSAISPWSRTHLGSLNLLKLDHTSQQISGGYIFVFLKLQRSVFRDPLALAISGRCWGVCIWQITLKKPLLGKKGGKGLKKRGFVEKFV